MSIPANNVSIGLPTKKSHYDALYDNAILADTGGTAGGAQTIPGHKTFSSGLVSVIRKTITSSYTILDNDYLTEIWSNAVATQTVTLPTVLDNIERTVLVYNINSGRVIIDGEGAELIQDTATISLPSKYDFASLKSIGTEWVIDKIKASYDTGWIARSLWQNKHLGSDDTKNADSNVTHNLNAPLSNLRVKVFISTDGTDANSFEVPHTDYSDQVSGTIQTGAKASQVDNDNIEIQTGAGGIFFLGDVGTTGVLTTQDYYYKVKVWYLG